MGGSGASSPIVISDDDDEEMNPVSPPPAAAVLPGNEYKWPLATAEWIEDDDVPRPDWLADGFGMESYRETEDDTPQPTNFFCPVTGISFGTKNEQLEYCFSGGLERANDAIKTLRDQTTLQGKYAWLRGDHKWLLEIRAGGENGRKMYKVYAHPSSKVRVTSRAEVMRLIDEGNLPDESTNNEDYIDTSNKDNIIAQLDFNISSLPPGWVKEIAFRKCNDGIRTDRYYTDPVTEKVFRSLKAAEQFFKHGIVMDCFNPSLSVTDLYSFDGCIDMPPWLARRLKMNATKDQCEEECQTSCSMIIGDSKEDEDEPGALLGSGKVGVNGEGFPCGDGLEDGRRSRSLADLYSVQIEKGNLKGKGKKKE